MPAMLSPFVFARRPPPQRPAPALAAALLAALALLAGCAQPGAPEAAAGGTPDQAGPDDAACASAACPPLPRQRNLTRLPTLLLAGDAPAGGYLSMELKSTYSFDAQGRLHLDTAAAEPLIAPATADNTGGPCAAPQAAPGPQAAHPRALWLPDTALFIHGGTLADVRNGVTARAETLHRLPVDGGAAAPATPAASAPARAADRRMPCVGAQRASEGWRSSRLLAPGDRLSIKPAQGKPFTLRLPSDHQPYVLLGYSPSGKPADGPVAAVPMRIVLATVDVPARRLVLQWQATAPRTPRIYDLAWSLLPDARDMRDYAPAQKTFVRHLRAHLAACPLPTQPMNPCASPQRALQPAALGGLAP